MLKKIISSEQSAALNKNLELIQANVESALTPLQQSPLTGGNLLTDVLLTSGVDNKLSHRLGVTPTLWALVRQDTNTTVWEVSADARFLTLRCGANCTVSVWVK